MRPLLVIFIAFCFQLTVASDMKDPLSISFESLRGRFSRSSLPLPEEMDIQAIEKTIGFSLPNDLRRFCLEVSNLNFEVYDPATANGGVSSYLYNVINAAWGEGESKDWIAFCEADGGYFCIHKATQAVKLFSSTPGHGEKNYLNLADWIDKIYFESAT